MRFSAILAAALLAVASVPAAAGTLDRIRESGEIRLGVRTDAAPHSYFNANGDAAGYAVEVCKAAVETMVEMHGVPIKPVYVKVTAEDRFAAVAEGRVDLLCGATSITLQRRAIVDFSIPTFVDGAAVMLHAGVDPSFEALAGKKIGVRAGTTTEESLRATLATGGMKAEIVPVESHDDGLALLEKGEIDAYFGDQSILYSLYFKSDKKDDLRVSTNTLTLEKQGLALARGDADFRLEVDRALSEVYRSGRMVEIFRESFPGATPSPGLKALFVLAPERP